MRNRVLSIDGATNTGTCARRWGAGYPKLLLIHGFGDGAFVWNAVAPALAASGGVLAIDLPGHGDSAHNATAEYRLSEYVADVHRILQSPDLRDMVLMGHSLGAEIAIEVTARARNVRGLVIVDSGPGLNEAAVAFMRERFVQQRWDYDDPEAHIEELKARLPLAAEQTLRGIAGDALKPVGHRFALKCDRNLAASKLSCSDDEKWALLREIRVPVLIVRGAGSAILPRSSAERMLVELPSSSLQTVPAAGHAVMLDNPSGFCAAVEPFIAKIFSAEQEYSPVQPPAAGFMRRSGDVLGG